MTKKTPTAEETQNLRQLLLALRTKYQSAIEELSAKETFQEEHTALVQQLTALKKSFREQKETHAQEISRLEREKNRIEKLEAELLEKDKRIADLMYLEHNLKTPEQPQTECEDLNAARQHISQLERTVAFLRDRSDASLLEGQHQKEEVERELQNLQGQYEGLQARLHQLQRDLEGSKLARADAQRRVEAAEAGKEVLEKLLEEKERHNASFDREIALIKQTLMRGVREMKDLEANYEAAVHDKMVASQKAQHAQYQVDRLREEGALLQEKLQGANKEQQNLRQALEEKTAKQEDLNELERHLAIAQQESRVLHEEVFRLKEIVKEREADLAQAQHHFAKKVKEAALLESKNEELQRTNSDLQQMQHQNRIKIAELQTSVDMQKQQQQKLEQQLQEGAKAAELLNGKWEQKYFALYDKWQQAETRTKELEKVEEKQKHLQGILSNIGTYLTPASEPVLQPPPRPVIEELTAPTPHPKATSNLFDQPKSQAKVRQSFLE